MKASLYLCVAAVTFLSASAGMTSGARAAIDFTGKWTVTGAITGEDVSETVSPTCTFKQDGDALSGSCEGANGLGSAEGAVDDDTIVWHWKRVAKNDNIWDSTITFRGELGKDGVIRGQWKDDYLADAVGTFVAQRLKQ